MAFWKKNDTEEQETLFIEALIGAPDEYIEKIAQLCYEHGFKHEAYPGQVDGRGMIKVALPKEPLDKVLDMASSPIGRRFFKQ